MTSNLCFWKGKCGEAANAKALSGSDRRSADGAAYEQERVAGVAAPMRPSSSTASGRVLRRRTPRVHHLVRTRDGERSLPEGVTIIAISA